MGLIISTLFSGEIIHIQYLPFPFPFIHITRFARVGRTIMLYASVIQMCYSVFFTLTLRWNSLFTPITFFFFFTIQNLLCVFLFYLLYYLSMSWLFIQVFFSFTAYDFCLLYSISLTFFFFLLSLINNNQPTNPPLN